MSRRIVAGFDREDLLLSAVTQARKRGYPMADVFTPYPVHGMDEALGVRPTRLGILCFVLGAAGAGMAWALQYWTHSVDWRVNVGGRPFNAWPAYVPVAFEVMILMAGLGTVLAFFAASRLHPGKRALPPEPRATDDRFIVVVEGRDAAVDTAAVADFLRRHGAVSVEEQETPPTARGGFKVSRCLLPGLAAVLAGVVVLSRMTVFDPGRPNDALLAEMAAPVSYPAYSAHPDLPGGLTMQPPREGSIARGRLPLRFGTDPAEAERAGRELSSPLKPGDAAALERGGRVYANFCGVCHGPEGKGDGPVTKRGVPPPPSLLEGRAVKMAPGQMFHVTTYGQGNMPAHAGQIGPEDRWAVVMHLLSLQKR